VDLAQGVDEAESEQPYGSLSRWADEVFDRVSGQGLESAVAAHILDRVDQEGR
jgi:hypothetical protein